MKYFYFASRDKSSNTTNILFYSIENSTFHIIKLILTPKTKKPFIFTKNMEEKEGEEEEEACTLFLFSQFIQKYENFF